MLEDAVTEKMASTEEGSHGETGVLASQPGRLGSVRGAAAGPHGNLIPPQNLAPPSRCAIYKGGRIKKPLLAGSKYVRGSAHAWYRSTLRAAATQKAAVEAWSRVSHLQCHASKGFWVLGCQPICDGRLRRSVSWHPGAELVRPAVPRYCSFQSAASFISGRVGSAVGLLLWIGLLHLCAMQRCTPMQEVLTLPHGSFVHACFAQSCVGTSTCKKVLSTNTSSCRNVDRSSSRVCCRNSSCWKRSGARLRISTPLTATVPELLARMQWQLRLARVSGCQCLGSLTGVGALQQVQQTCMIQPLSNIGNLQPAALSQKPRRCPELHFGSHICVVTAIH